MDWTWIDTSLVAVLMVTVSTLGIYFSLILLTRWAGLRSFSKMSSFDFAVTIAIGSVIASTIVTPNPPLVQGAVALAVLYGLQMLIATLRTRWKPARQIVDNDPLLLMVGDRVIEEHMHKARVTEADLKAKLREANVIDRRQIRAVVMESTGDISVLHASPDGPSLEPWLLDGVRGAASVHNHPTKRMKKTLIVSISGIRGIFGSGLDASTLVTYASAYGVWCRQQAQGSERKPLVVVGRDGRVTGDLCARLVTATLQSVGCDVLDVGLATTPSVEMAVIGQKATGGIVLSASHNPPEWNALKLLNAKGEFLSAEEGEAVLALAEATDEATLSYERIGTYRQDDVLDDHIAQILALDFIRPDEIAAQDFRIVVDGINSVGGIALPRLLERLGVRAEQILVLNGEPTGRFAHPAEPLPQNLEATIAYVDKVDADLGLVVDPDADRLALIANGGRYVSEELTQVIAADFLWRFRSGPFVTNLSSSRAIEDVAKKYGAEVYRSAVGEINVVKKMQAVGAVLGGEGNGGVILPDLHYGRDALVAAAMVLQHLANLGTSLADFVDTLPAYTLSKNKIPIGDHDPDALLATMADRYRDADISTLDGVKIDLAEGWVHLRTSNTEPIIRVYAEAGSQDAADALARRFMSELEETAALS